MLWDSDLPIQEYTDTHVYTTIYDQGSFEPVARLAWLRDDISQPINDEPENDEGWYGNNKPEPPSAIQIYHYHNDQLGTPNELTNDKGEVVWLADYEAWGNTAKVIYAPVKINQIQVSQNELQPIRFQGQHFDEETGLHYNRFRYYDPDMGMFTTRDPIELDGGLNVFSYAPNPTGWIDPSGLNAGAAAGSVVGKALETIAKLASKAGRTGAKVSTVCTSCEDDKKEEENCGPKIAEVKSKLYTVKFRYYDLLVDRHELYASRKSKIKSRNGTWSGHIFQYEKAQGELGDAMTNAGTKCRKYFPKDAEYWYRKPPPDRPDKEYGISQLEELKKEALFGNPADIKILRN